MRDLKPTYCRSVESSANRPGCFWVSHPCSRCSTTLAVTAFTTIGSPIDLFRSFRWESVFTCSRADTVHAELIRGFQNQPVTFNLFSRHIKAIAQGMAAVACDSFEPQVRAG